MPSILYRDTQDNKARLRRRKRTANGGQVSTRRHECRWCPFFRLGFRFLPHVHTTPRTSAPLLHRPFTADPSSTLHHIHIPLSPHSTANECLFHNTPAYTHPPPPAPLTNEYLCHRWHFRGRHLGGHLQCVFCARSQSPSSYVPRRTVGEILIGVDMD